MGLGGLLRLAIIVMLGWLLYRGLRSLLGASPQRPRTPSREDTKVIDELVEDPNCGTWLPRRQAISARIKGKELFFCSKRCYEEYVRRLKEEERQ